MLNMMKQETPIAKVVMLGNSNQGKSAIVLKFLTGNFVEEHDPTIEDVYSSYHVCDKKPIILEILDTSGLEQDREALGHLWIKESDIFVLVYAVNSEVRHRSSLSGDSSLHDLTLWRDKILAIKETITDQKLPIILVANKCDIDENLQTIPRQKGQQLADDWDCPLVEVSALSGFGLDNLWNIAVREYWKSQRKAVIHEFEHKQEESAKSTCCNCACFQRKTDAIQSVELKDEASDLELQNTQLSDIFSSTEPTQKRVGDKIRLYDVHRLPDDHTFEPIISSKNYEIVRRFGCKRFIKSIFCGIFLPILIVFQTIVFCVYKEEKEGQDPTQQQWYFKYYPYSYKYDDIHYSIFKDFLGLIVGREPHQDPETIRNRKWFLRQSGAQLFSRTMLSIVVIFIFCVLWYNVINSNNDEFSGVSNMETFGPFALYWVIWILLSLWIANNTDVNPRLPLVSKLRSIDLYFGPQFNVTTSAYKIIRGYLYSENKYWVMPCAQKLFIFCVALLYSLIPGITRMIVKDDNDDYYTFVVSDSEHVQIGALLVNFVLISVLLFIIESQYSRHFGNYKKWMTDLTMILNENQMYENDENDIETSQAVFCSELFLSLRRNSNALGWLEIRSFMAVKGMLFFGEQEFPILWILFIAGALTAFIVYRVYFIAGSALASVVFNGVMFLTIVCLILLMRICATALQFQSLQAVQERLVGQQKFFMKCRRKYQDEEDEDDAYEYQDFGDYKQKDSQMKPLMEQEVDNTQFLQDMLYVISKVDIYPRIFQMRLAPILNFIITLLVICIIFIIFKIFLDAYALRNAEMVHIDEVL